MKPVEISFSKRQLLALSPIVQLTSQDGRAAVNDASRPNQQDQLHYLTVLFMAG